MTVKLRASAHGTGGMVYQVVGLSQLLFGVPKYKGCTAVNAKQREFFHRDKVMRIAPVLQEGTCLSQGFYCDEHMNKATLGGQGLFDLHFHFVVYH